MRRKVIERCGWRGGCGGGGGRGGRARGQPGAIRVVMITRYAPEPGNGGEGPRSREPAAGRTSGHASLSADGAAVEAGGASGADG